MVVEGRTDGEQVEDGWRAGTGPNLMDRSSKSPNKLGNHPPKDDERGRAHVNIRSTGRTISLLLPSVIVVCR